MVLRHLAHALSWVTYGPSTRGDFASNVALTLLP